MAPYVHAGYQVSIIFASFFVARSLGLFGGWDRDAQAVLAALAIVLLSPLVLRGSRAKLDWEGLHESKGQLSIVCLSKTL